MYYRTGRTVACSSLGVPVEERPFQWLAEDIAQPEPSAQEAQAAAMHGPKPARKTGITEIRGCFHDILGKRRLMDLFDAVGPDIDGVKLSGSAVTSMQRQGVVDLIDLAHDSGAYVSCCGGVEVAAAQGQEALERFLQECRSLGFDALEFGGSFDAGGHEIQLVSEVKKAGLQAKPKIVECTSDDLRSDNSSGDSLWNELRASSHAADPGRVMAKAERCFEAGADAVVLCGEVIMEDAAWDARSICGFVDAFGMERLLFEAPHPEVCEWLARAFGKAVVNISVDHTALLQLQMLRHSRHYRLQHKAAVIV